MTTQEAISKVSDSIKGLEGRDTATVLISAVSIILRAAEENEGRRLAEKWDKEPYCIGCPLEEACLMFACQVDKFEQYREAWIEAAKKEKPFALWYPTSAHYNSERESAIRDYIGST